jgi:uncharacterized protein YkwD
MKCRFLLITPFVCLGQIQINQDSLNLYFSKILNQERVTCNLSPVKVDISLSSFTTEWVNFMSNHNYLGHGTDATSFTERLKKYRYTEGEWVENCSRIPLSNLSYMKQSNTKQFIQQYNNGDISQYGLALIVYYVWKNSPPHYQGMMNPKTNRIYVSSCWSSTGYFFSYLGTG